MLKTTLAGLRAHRLRLLLTSVAIALGVGFITGTFVLTDALRAGADQAIAASAGKVDVAVTSGAAWSDHRCGHRRIPPSAARRARSAARCSRQWSSHFHVPSVRQPHGWRSTASQRAEKLLSGLRLALRLRRGM